MDIDPRINVVVFQLRRGKEKHLVGRVPTLAEDGVAQAWDSVEQQHSARAKHVVALHTEWEPTATDAAFIAETFPGATATHHFVRPAADGWDAAFTAAGIALRAELRPLLWSASAPTADALVDVPHWPVAGGRLHLALAVVTSVGTYPVQYAQLGDASFDDLMADTCRAVADTIDYEEREPGLLAVSGRLVAALACLPEFYRRLSGVLGAERLVVGLLSADEVLVAAAGNAAIDEAVLAADVTGGELVPCVLLIEGDRIEVLAERGAGSEA